MNGVARYISFDLVTVSVFHLNGDHSCVKASVENEQVSETCICEIHFCHHFSLTVQVGLAER